MQNQIHKKRQYIQNPFSLFSKYSFGANKRAASKMNKETANKKKTQAVNWFRKEIVCKIRVKKIQMLDKIANVRTSTYFRLFHESVTRQKKRENNSKKQNGRKIRPRRTLGSRGNLALETRTKTRTRSRSRYWKLLSDQEGKLNKNKQNKTQNNTTKNNNAQGLNINERRSNQTLRNKPLYH